MVKLALLLAIAASCPVDDVAKLLPPPLQAGRNGDGREGGWQRLAREGQETEQTQESEMKCQVHLDMKG